jgi:Na+-transporting methylmalonyl-CoA/oxaloacetate decarboxylase beta subunit
MRVQIDKKMEKEYKFPFPVATILFILLTVQFVLIPLPVTCAGNNIAEHFLVRRRASALMQTELLNDAIKC